MRRLVRWLTNVVLGFLVLMAVVFILLPAVFASRLAVVYSGSMGAAMPLGAVAVMMPVDPVKIKVGDIIAFTQPGSTSNVTVSHRVIEVVHEPAFGFQTKGDVNEDPDPFIVPVENVLARVPFHIPRGGYVLALTMKYTKGRVGFGLFVALPTVLLIGSALRDVNIMLNPRMRRVRRRKEMLERRRRRRTRW